MNKTLIPTIFKAVAVPMGIAVVTMNAIGTLVPATADILLGVGLTALAFASFLKKE